MLFSTLIKRAWVEFPKQVLQLIGALMKGCPTMSAPKMKPSSRMFIEKTKTVEQGASTLGAGDLKPLRLTVVVMKWQKNDTRMLVSIVSKTFPWPRVEEFGLPWICFEVTLP